MVLQLCRSLTLLGCVVLSCSSNRIDSECVVYAYVHVDRNASAPVIDDDTMRVCVDRCVDVKGCHLVDGDTSVWVSCQSAPLTVVFSNVDRNKVSSISLTVSDAAGKVVLTRSEHANLSSLGDPDCPHYDQTFAYGSSHSSTSGLGGTGGDVT